MWGQGSVYKEAERIAALQMAKSKSNNKKDRDTVQTSDSSSSFSEASSSAEMSASEAPKSKNLNLISNLQAQEMITSLETLVQDCGNREADLKRIIDEHLQLGRARQVNDNRLGAILSMKKVKRLQQFHLEPVVETKAKATKALQQLGDAYEQASLQTLASTTTSKESGLDASTVSCSKKTRWFKVSLEHDTTLLATIRGLIENNDPAKITTSTTTTTNENGNENGHQNDENSCRPISSWNEEELLKEMATFGA